MCEHSRAGAAAIDVARRLAETEDVAVTVVGVAPQAPSGPRCGNSALEYNDAVADSVVRDLERARERLGPVARRASFRLLVAPFYIGALFIGAAIGAAVRIEQRRRRARPRS